MLWLMRTTWWSLLAIFLAAASACTRTNPDRLPVYPVNGKVLYKAVSACRRSGRF